MGSDAVRAALNPKGGLDVNIQDQTTDVISLFMAQILDTATVLTNTVKDDETVDIETTGVTPVVGNFLCLQESGKISQTEILSVTPIAGNQYTVGIAIPLDYPYTTAGGCSIQNVDMNVNGAITPVSFINKPIGGFKWDITRLMVAMVLTTSGDDGKFGNIAALTNGQYFRKEDTNTSQNIFNIKDNSDFRVEGYDVTYPLRSGGGGDFGMAARITYGGQSKHGVTIRLDGDLNESFKCVVRDDLTGISKYRVKLQGHVVD